MSSKSTRQTATIERAWQSPRAWVVVLFVLCCGLAADLASKSWAFQTVAGEPVVIDREAFLNSEPGGYAPIPFHEGMKALPWGLLDFKLVLNPGAVFGIGAGQRGFFIWFTVAAILIGVLIVARSSRSSLLAHIAIGLILAGGLGNLYDRINFAQVRDFLHMLPHKELPFGWRWPSGSPEIFPWVFNVADVMLLTGMGIMMIHINRTGHKPRAEKSEETDGDQPAAAATFQSGD